MFWSGVLAIVGVGWIIGLPGTKHMAYKTPMSKPPDLVLVLVSLACPTARSGGCCCLGSSSWGLSETHDSTSALASAVARATASSKLSAA
jgi:hypothetical protein